MYRIDPYYEIDFSGTPSTIMYTCDNFLPDLSSEFPKSSCGDVSSHQPAVSGSSTTPKRSGNQKTTGHHHGVSEFESRQLAVLSQLQQLGTRLDKISGTSESKKRGSAQTKDVKRQKTDSCCRAPDEPPVPETIVLKEQPEFASYEIACMKGVSYQFPLNIIVSSASPLPFSLFVLAHLARNRPAPGFNIGVKSFVHSSAGCINDSMKSKIQRDFFNLVNDGNDVSQCPHMINFIWMKDAQPKGPIMLHGACVESRTSSIVGELAIAKYLASLSGFYPRVGFAPEGTFLTSDYWLYTADGFAKPAYPEIRTNVLKEMSNVLGKRRFLIGDRVSFADVMMWSTFIQSGVNVQRWSKAQMPPNVKTWFMTLNSTKQFQAARALLA